METIQTLSRQAADYRFEAETAFRAGNTKESERLLALAEITLNKAERLQRGDQLDPNTPRQSDRSAMGVSKYVGQPEDIYLRTADRNTLQVSQDGQGGFAVRPSLVREAFVDETAQGALDRAGAVPVFAEGDAYEEVIVEGDTIQYLPEIPTGNEHANPDVKMFRAVFNKVGDLQFISEFQASTQSVDVTGAVIRNTVDQVKAAEDAALNGTGIGLQPIGMLRDETLTRYDIEGTTGTTISNTTSDMGSATKLVRMMGVLPSRFHDTAVWMMHGSTFAAVRALTDAEGRPYFPEAYTGNVLVGKPVILNDGMPVGGTADQAVIIFGSFKRGFRRVYRESGLSIRRLNERYAERDLIGIRTRFYFAHGVIAPQAFVIGVADAVV